jgi:hypothetical protein
MAPANVVPLQRRRPGREPGQNYQSAQSTVGLFTTNNPGEYDLSEDANGEFSVTKLSRQYLDYIGAKQLEIEEQKLSRHYRHGAQYTAEEVRALRARRQPIITYNEIGPKIDQIVGLVERLRQEPKAYPKHPRSESGAQVASASLRAVLDANEWETYTASFVAEQLATEGIAGVELDLIEGDHDDPDIALNHVFGEDFFYDPRSMKADFSDARWMGVAKWMDVNEAVEMFPDQEEDIRTLMVESGYDMTTHSDREIKWIYVNEGRLRLVEHWYKNKGMWFYCFYCGTYLELERGVSKFRDQRGNPINKYCMASAFVDHEGDRYAFVRLLKSPQDETNQRRAKALHLSNVTRIKVQKGAVDDVETTRREMARPDGLIEWNKGYDPPMADDKQEDLAAHLSLMQDARQKIISFANVNPAILAQPDTDEHSGVAINLMQKAALAELGSFLRNYRNWKIRVYRNLWNTIVNTWQGERWIRVAGEDENGMAQFLQLNGQRLDQYGLPTMINFVGAIDVDIALDEGPDTSNLMQDAYDLIKQLPPGTIPPTVLIEFMSLPGSLKQKILRMLSTPPPPDPQVARAKELTNQRLEAEVGEKRAGTVGRIADAQKKMHDAHIDTFQSFTDFLKLFQKADVLDPGNISQEGTAAQATGGIAAAPRPMAEGGIVTRPTHALLGERGPEAVIPLTNPLEQYLGNMQNDSWLNRQPTLQDILRAGAGAIPPDSGGGPSDPLPIGIRG